MEEMPPNDGQPMSAEDQEAAFAAQMAQMSPEDQEQMRLAMEHEQMAAAQAAQYQIDPNTGQPIQMQDPNMMMAMG